MNIVEKAPRYLFFTGKGGVGKTSLSCAVAIALADRGKKVLLVSTDPASNLDEVLQVDLLAASAPQAVPGLVGLFALNIDPEAAAQAYRERLIGPYRNLLPEATVRSMEEQLSGSCTTEIAAFDQFAKLIGDSEQTAQYEHVIFDTAPTGHTLRLLSLPESWSKFIAENTTGMSCLGPLSGLQEQQGVYLAAVQTLKDAARTMLVLVARAERSALREAAETSAELKTAGMGNQCLVVNGVFEAHSEADEIAMAFAARGKAALAAMPTQLVDLPLQEVPLSPLALLGVAALRTVFAGPESPPGAVIAAQRQPLDSLLVLIEQLEAAGSGLIMTMGKGGVGKTTVAAAVAVELARRGHRVHLSTTDPAAHLAWILEVPVPLLTVSRIDPAAETAAYRQEVMSSAGVGLDAQGLALLEEDLRSPCSEEVAVFRAFAATVAQGEHGFVVLDTAPTGHTILLLDAAQAYHREVLRQSSNMPDAVLNLLPRLRDPCFTHILIVTLAEATPVHEARRLQEDLRRAGIEPYGWIINQSLWPVETTDPVLVCRRTNEGQYINEVSKDLSRRTALVPWLKVPPCSVAGLSEMLRYKYKVTKDTSKTAKNE